MYSIAVKNSSFCTTDPCSSHEAVRCEVNLYRLYPASWGISITSTQNSELKDMSTCIMILALLTADTAVNLFRRRIRGPHQPGQSRHLGQRRDLRG